MLCNAGIAQLNTTFTEPLAWLESHFLKNCDNIEKWFADQWQQTLPPIYGSVDLRNAGFKLAPIDMNLFPAGFNNLNPSFLSIAIKAAQKIIKLLAPTARSLLLIPESHTRNLFYWENINTLKKILEQAHYEVILGALNDNPLNIQLASGETLSIQLITRKENRLYCEGSAPDIIILNNDLSEGIPDLLQGLSQQIIPPAALGWSQRLKSEHFQYYAQVADDFARVIDFDPWLIAPLFRHCGQVDFMQQSGSECLISNAELLFESIEKKYQAYQIPYQPFIIVKADAGTYGMAVMTVRNVEELKSLNRKQRTRMSKTKSGQPVDRVILQEGVYTFETIGEAASVAEPVVYLWGNEVIGGFYRVHKDKGVDENLNSPGMQFEPIAFSQTCHRPEASKANCETQNRFYLYGIVAQLSMLAAAREIKEQGST